jgi:hypothetical protein
MEDKRASKPSDLPFKNSLIKAFALNWANFNFVSGHLIDGLDHLAGRLIGSATIPSEARERGVPRSSGNGVKTMLRQERL